MKNLSNHSRRKLKSVLNSAPHMNSKQLEEYLSNFKVTVPLSLLFLCHKDGETQGYMNNRGGCSHYDFKEFIKKL